MGKTCTTIMGLGVAGALIGLHIYMFLDPKDQKMIQRELRMAVDDLKKATAKLAESCE